MYQGHWPDLHTPPEETAEALGELVREGKIRHAGVSNYDVDQIAALGRYGRVDTLQPPYHLFRREIEDKVLPYTAEHDIGVLIYGPLAHGLLAGRMTPSTTFEPDDWRSKSPDFSGETFRRNRPPADRGDLRGCRARAGPAPRRQVERSSGMATVIPSPAAGAARAARTRTDRARGGPGWRRIFLGGLALWVATVAVTFATRNPNLVPTVILIGSFLVPVTFVAYAFQRADAVVNAQRIFTAFIYGGTLGVLGASLLEAEFLKQPTAGTYVYVGLIEEAVKLGALWLIARHLPRYTMRDGIVLGAAVGFGFAALESAGYAFNALFTLNGLSLTSLVETEVLRGILAPLGHGLWTAILGGALFATAARHGRPRLTGGVVGWYLVVAALHTLWDSSQAIAVWLTLLLTGTQVQWLMIQLGRIPVPTQAQVHLYTGLNWTLLFVDALIGLLVLRRSWRRATATDPPLEVEPPTGAGVGAGPGVGV